MNTITLSEGDIDEIIDNTIEGQTIEGAVGSWKWGKTKEFIFQRESKFYMVKLRYQLQEGLLREGTYTAVEVEKVEVTTTKWVPVKS